MQSRCIGDHFSGYKYLSLNLVAVIFLDRVYGEIVYRQIYSARIFTLDGERVAGVVEIGRHVLEVDEFRELDYDALILAALY